MTCLYNCINGTVWVLENPINISSSFTGCENMIKANCTAGTAMDITPGKLPDWIMGLAIGFVFFVIILMELGVFDKYMDKIMRRDFDGKTKRKQEQAEEAD